MNTTQSIPHKDNFCGGNFQDWLEVNLTPKCNAKCSWCIERNGYHPNTNIGWEKLSDKIILSGKKNVILLGGEPTLYQNIGDIIRKVFDADINLYVTTNGSMLTPEFIYRDLTGIYGINISIHSYDFSKNEEITGIKICSFINIIDALNNIGAKIRLNCNCISGYIDSETEIINYIEWAKSIGVIDVRFAELKNSDGEFVDLANVMDYKYGLNDDPFCCGCNKNAIINGVNVSFRQMCGLQTDKRNAPENPKQYVKKVLYYDGKFYDGWQTIAKESNLKDKDIIKILREVQSGSLTSEEAFAKLKGIREKEVIKETVRYENSGGCTY